MEFRCRLGTAAGQVIEGIYIAPSEAHLRRELEDKGLHVLALTPRGGVVQGFSLGRRKIRRDEFLIFNQELATLLKAGMPLVQSLDILRQRLTNPVFKAVLDDVHEKVRGGTALSDAFAAHADLFPGVYTASLMAGERSGSLDQVLRRFVAYSKVIDTVRRKTVSAMLYPAILTVLAVALVGIIVVKVVPAFSGFYQSFDQELERLINQGVVDRETGLSYATNRTNLQLRLDTQGAGATEKVAAPKTAPPRSTPPSGSSYGTPAHGVRKPGPGGGSGASGGGDSEFDDLIER